MSDCRAHYVDDNKGHHEIPNEQAKSVPTHTKNPIIHEGHVSVNTALLLQQASSHESLDGAYLRARWHVTSKTTAEQENGLNDSVQQHNRSMYKHCTAVQQQQQQQNEIHTPPMLRKEMVAEGSPLTGLVADVLLGTGLATVPTQDRLDVIQDHIYNLNEREGKQRALEALLDSTD